MYYIIFIDETLDTTDFIVQLKKFAKDFAMSVVDKDIYSKNSDFPISHIKLNYISSNEVKIRRDLAIKQMKDGVSEDVNPETNEKVYLGTKLESINGEYIFRHFHCTSEEFSNVSVFYSNEHKDDILEFLRLEGKKKFKEEVVPIKYTRFRDIPQLTRYGNWECDFTPEEMVKFIEGEIVEQGLNMNPDFQRGHVWTEEQQIAFVEFFLRGGKTGRVIYLNNPSWNFTVKEGYNDYVCVDGLQRYTAMKRFVNNEIKVFGSYYREFEDSIRGTNTMRININDLKSKKEVLQWYIEFNDGGTPHSKEEINRVRNLLAAES